MFRLNDSQILTLFKRALHSYSFSPRAKSDRYSLCHHMGIDAHCHFTFANSVSSLLLHSYLCKTCAILTQWATFTDRHLSVLCNVYCHSDVRRVCQCDDVGKYTDEYCDQMIQDRRMKHDVDLRASNARPLPPPVKLRHIPTPANFLRKYAFVTHALVV